ncbi:MAG: acyl-CoA dehydrogenase [Boseongicola sp.]|nr:acyl-CoA dehydrogenase [Boseongicola sp.]
MSYSSAAAEIQFLLENVVDYASVAATEKFEEASIETIAAVLGEAARLCDDVMYPLNRDGDLQPARLENGVVRTSPGFADAYQAIAEGGWVGIAADPEYGGMGLPQTANTALNEMMSGANLSLQLCPLLTQGQIEALEHHASDAIKALYLPKLTSGEWAGTMNLTESQAGSDVGAVRTKAEDNGDGTFSISGQKIYISWGDNDITENVCHLVLARLPGAPDGTKGISLFIVPKRVPDEQGALGAANSLRVVSLEHKLGLHGSPTAVMEFDGATGWMVGPENGGMAAMFTMMNNARLGVGVQGVGVAEAAYQKALAYAMDRKQGGNAIVDYPDVRRMLMAMKADTQAARAISLACAVAIDLGNATSDETAKSCAAFLTPIAKAFGTDVGVAVANDGIQVHGGMGFVEETGAAQYLRDVRVTAIYEGTNGIQAMDLVGRKMMDGGEAAYRLLDEIEGEAETARHTFPEIGDAVWGAAETLRETTEWLAEQPVQKRFAVAVPYLRAFARVLGGHYLLKAARSEGTGGSRASLARFYATRLLPEHQSLLAQVRMGDDGLFDIVPDDMVA